MARSDKWTFGPRAFVGYGLAAAVILGSVGCRTPVERAEWYRAQVSVGMGSDEVRTRLGDPDRVLPHDQGAMWLYQYSMPSGVGFWIAVVLLLPILLLGNTSGPASGEFRLHVDPQGRVIWISPVEKKR